MKASTLSIIAGVLAAIGGLFALVFPIPASLGVTLFVGISFLVSGALGLYAFVSDKDLPNRGQIGILSGLQLVLGIWLVARPIEGTITLTLAAGILFLLSGGGRIWFAFQTRGTPLFWTMLISGVLSVALGIYAVAFLPAASLVLLGTLLAVELISAGAALIALGVGLRKLQ